MGAAVIVFAVAHLSTAVFAAVPAQLAVQAALQQQIAEESLSSGGVPALESMTKAKVRSMACVTTGEQQARCTVDANGCETVDDVDHDGWCVRPVDLTFGEHGFLFQSKVMWFVTPTSGE